MLLSFWCKKAISAPKDRYRRVETSNFAIEKKVGAKPFGEATLAERHEQGTAFGRQKPIPALVDAAITFAADEATRF